MQEAENLKSITRYEELIEQLKQTKQDPHLVAYNKLNAAGKEEAIKRVEELTEIARYTQDERQSKLNA